ncbi:MAG: YidC/Oxa1 family membrane protein insertase, partial [Armatimonadota bacterium]
DPQQAQQQKMMAYMMPLMFFFFFQSFPAAFILYWLGSNVIYFGEQFLYMRRTSPQGVQAQPAGEQRGGGLVGAILRAARGAGRDSAPDQEHPPSYEEKRKQGKKRKRGRG